MTRGDDAGSCRSANRAILEACEDGILRNVSVMVPGPAFEEAAHLLAGHTEICLGLHVTLSSEWEGPRWGPVLPAGQVPSLVDPQRYFFDSPATLHQEGFRVEEVMSEVAAQLCRARESGLHISYLDEHMGVSWLPGLREEFAAFAWREGLVDAYPIPSLPQASVPGKDGVSDCMADWVERLAAAAPGAYVLITHPGYDVEDMRQFSLSGQPSGEVARSRDQERRALVDPRLLEACRAHGAELVRYTDVLSAG